MTPGCAAVMKVVNVGNVKEAFFRRLPTYPHHISANCVRCGITFDITKYDESKFKECHHTEPIAVVGIWRPTNGDSEAQFECDFVSSRQIYVVK